MSGEEKRAWMLIGNCAALHNIIGEEWKERVDSIARKVQTLQQDIMDSTISQVDSSFYLDFFELQILNIEREYLSIRKHFIQKEVK